MKRSWAGCCKIELLEERSGKKDGGEGLIGTSKLSGSRSLAVQGGEQPSLFVCFIYLGTAT